MKQILFLLLCLSTLTTWGQVSSRDSLRREVDSYIRTVYAAANTFLNKQLSAADRIKAIQPHAVLYDNQQKAAFKQVVMDNREPAEVRAAALNRIYELVPPDRELATLTTDWLVNPQNARPLRNEALNLANNLSFSSLMEVPEVYQKLLDDPELQFRQFGFAKLILQGDVRAQQRLIAGLANTQNAPLPAPTAIAILSMTDKKEHYPAVYRLFQQTKDEATRLEAIRALAFYAPAKQDLITISQNANEKETFREAALGALYNGDRQNIVKYVEPILRDKTASPRLQSLGIQMSQDIRQSIAFRKNSKRADSYDLLIKDIAEGKGTVRNAALEQVANKYIRSVRPKY